MPKKVLVGVVMNDKASKTRRVEIARLERHAKYKKIIRKKTVCHVHDENNESAVGDVVEFEESSPLSRLKRWKLVRVVEKSRAVDLAALRAARRTTTEQQDTLATLGDT
jgi:small subunit ribosomal protein S17